ncbi:hypothetical protein N7509_013653 [Penicillium cosmopolitanum]|uniref:Uncharacterized protein n=1 Tax=Penicillium cosmopolitanum TaxID=1131564 RepID=A0A9W9VCC3_9EURO|nr:uncharacterized protein N7509_013653 [Penicillium cosmopolitanum]KAJ5376767.1 hypothetical protein N7509_013653 [Penicillium cosmopolitanum]
MPPKKSFRKSLPARISNPTLSPSRRSPRGPTPSKPTNQPAPSAKAIDFTTTSSPPDTSYNPYLYIPKSPSSTATTNGKLQNSPSETPVKRRHHFPARPSRLSNVYTPAKEAQQSILTPGSRTTRRAAALGTPRNQTSDQEFPESLDTTDWGIDASPTSTSSATRLSARSRKLTTRAIEALDSKKKPRQKRTAPTPTPMEPPTEQADSDIDPMKIKSKRVKGKRANKIFKQLRMNKPSRMKIKLTADQAGQKLYEIVVVAFNTDFALPSDPEQFIANARKQFEQPSLVKSSEEEPVMSATATPTASTPSDPAAAEATLGNAGTSNMEETHVNPIGVTNGETNDDIHDEDESDKYAKVNGETNAETNGELTPEPPEFSSIKDFKKMEEPQLEAGGWTRTGYVNDTDEEILLTPPGQIPYRAPHTYGDMNLPFPPVISRSQQQIEIDNNLGFPPLIGDRNIPFCSPSEFSTEDVTEEKARAQAHKRKRSLAELAKVPRKKKRESTKTTEPSATTEEKPKIQRLKLKLNPPTEADRQAGAVIASAPDVTLSQRGTAGRGRGRGRGGPGTPRGKGISRGASRGRSTPRGSTRGALRGTPRGGSSRGGSSRASTPRSRGRGRGRGKQT